MYYTFVPDPNCMRRYKESQTLEAMEDYLRVHQRVFRPFVKGKKCTILEKGTDLIVKVHCFK